LEVTHVDAAGVVHGRGAFRTEEIEAIAGAARTGPTFRDLTGNQRALLYAFASSTGLRAKECAAARKEDFGPEYSYVRISGQFTKNGADAAQPIPSFLRPAMAEYVATLGDDDFLWPGDWAQDDQSRWVEAGWIAGKSAGEFLRRDAAKVGIVIGREGKEANGGLVLDFHSFRHCYVTQLARAGISEELSRKLARASCRRSAGGIPGIPARRYSFEEGPPTRLEVPFAPLVSVLLSDRSTPAAYSPVRIPPSHGVGTR
jgi:integrase